VCRKQVRERSPIVLEIPAGNPDIEEIKHGRRTLKARVLRTRRLGRAYSCAVKFSSPMRAGSARS
jgi:hypothetical protein